MSSPSSPGNAVAKAYDLMLNDPFRHLVVDDYERDLVGLLTHRGP